MLNPGRAVQPSLHFDFVAFSQQILTKLTFNVRQKEFVNLFSAVSPLPLSQRLPTLLDKPADFNPVRSFSQAKFFFQPLPEDSASASQRHAVAFADDECML